MSGPVTKVCYDCALAITLAEIVSCPRCGSTDFDPRRSRPRRFFAEKSTALPAPWSKLDLPKGGTVLLSGNRGSGKTTICLAANPARISSSEQQNQQVAMMWNRIRPGVQAPIISTVRTAEELADDLSGLQEDELGVVDSISQLQAGPRANDVLKAAIDHLGKVGARAIFIAQFTKDGDMLGTNQLAHLVDVYATIPDDATGTRRLAIIKNRFGDLFTTYFSLGAHGVGEQVFRHAYSVEGSAGNYHLHLFPMGGAKLSGILDALALRRIDIMGTASAALACSAYPHGFVEPDDAERRKAFAEDHGLSWIDPLEAERRVLESINEQERA